MACPRVGPCLWPELTLCCLNDDGEIGDPCLAGGVPVPQALIDSAAQAAAELMWARTGRQFGTCTVTIRPCKKSCNPCPGGDFIDSGWGGGFRPTLVGGLWYNLPPCGCSGDCSCDNYCSIELPRSACCIEQVIVDGVVLDSDQYRIDDFHRLVRVRGVADVDEEPPCWPACQDLASPDTEVGTWSVTLQYGKTVPELVLLATAELACQFIKACLNQPCQLPQRMASVARQGVTVSFIDPAEFFKDGRTGIYIVDLAIATFNPHGITRRPAITSLDYKNWSVTTGGSCP